MAKNLFKCGDCSYVWAGKPLKSRTHVRTNKSNQSTIRCPSCHNWSGLFVSEDVPSSLLLKKSIATRESREAGVVKEPAEKDFDTYLRLLDKTKTAESLKHSIRQLSSSSDDFDKLLKVLLVKNAQGGGGDFEGLKRDINDLKVAVASLKSSPGSNPGTSGPSAGELLLRRVIETVPLAPPAPANPFGINSLDDLRKASTLFTSKSGRNVLDLEAERIHLEGQMKREEAQERARWHDRLLKTFDKVPQEIARTLGKEIIDGYERAREKRRGNPHLPIPKGFTSPKPIKISGTPIPGTDHLKIECPSCRSPIEYNQSSSRVFCVNCKSTWTVLPDESQSPGGSSPSRAKEAYPGVESRAPSGDYHSSGSVKESAVVVGGRVREGDTKVSSQAASKKQKGGKK